MSRAIKLTCLDCGQVNRVPAEKPGAGAKCGTCGARLIDGKVREVDGAILRRAARHDDLPLVVDFWAPWCGHCRMMAPEFSKSAQELVGRVRLAKLNTEAHPQAGGDYRIRGIPTMIGFRGGREKARQSGALQAAAITSWARGI